jgi:hypothetical protein
MKPRTLVTFAVTDDCEAVKIASLLEALGYETTRVGAGGEVSAIDADIGGLVARGWRGVGQLARAWSIGEAEIEQALERVGLAESRAHAVLCDPPIYSPALQRLVELDLRSRGLLGPSSSES